MNKTILNLSGHPLSKPAKKLFEKKYDRIITSEPLHVDFMQDIEEQIKNFLCTINLTIDGSFPLTVIPPGQSTIAVVLLAYLHGLTGYFPTICYLDQNEDGVYVPVKEISVNLQAIRAFARGIR